MRPWWATPHLALTALWQPVLTASWQPVLIALQQQVLAAAPTFAAALAELVPRLAVASLVQLSNLAADSSKAVDYLVAVAATAATILAPMSLIRVAYVDFVASF